MYYTEKYRRYANIGVKHRFQWTNDVDSIQLWGVGNYGK